MCGCIYGCTLSILRDALVANAECTYIVMCVCALSMQYQTLSRAAFLPYMKTVRYSYLTFA